jgi:hypothetical protein
VETVRTFATHRRPPPFFFALCRAIRPAITYLSKPKNLNDV